MDTVVILEYNMEQAAEQSNMAIGSFEAKFSIWIYGNINIWWSLYFRLQPRTEVLLKALVSKGVDNRDSLLKAWRTDPTCKLEFFSFIFLEEIKIECVFQFSKQS